MTHLGTLWIAYGFARQKQHVFLATDSLPRVGDELAEVLPADAAQLLRVPRG